jgi:hypothetical protein
VQHGDLVHCARTQSGRASWTQYSNGESRCAFQQVTPSLVTRGSLATTRGRSLGGRTMDSIATAAVNRTLTRRRRITNLRTAISTIAFQTRRAGYARLRLSAVLLASGALLSISTLFGCGARSASQRVNGPDGRGIWFVVKCKDRMDCIAEAGSVCPYGYDIATEERNTSVSGAAGGGSAWFSVDTRRGALIKCHPWPVHPRTEPSVSTD